MLFDQFNQILTLDKKGNLLGLEEILMILPSPSTLLDPWNLQRIDFKCLLDAQMVDSCERIARYL
jgi:hypothetical protein